MKNLKAILFLAALAVLSISLTSCGSEEEVGPANEITDNSGITLSLEWSTGGTTDKAKSDIDLNLYLLKGTTIIEQSDYYYSYESIDLKNIYQDGEYEVRITYPYISKAGTYSIYATGIANTNNVVKNTGSISVTQEGTEEERNLVLRITKKGSTYSIVEIK